MATILECVNYNTNYSPSVEARSCPTKANNAGKSKYEVQTICAGHSKHGDPVISEIKSGDAIKADVINTLIGQINEEIKRRKQFSDYSNLIPIDTSNQNGYIVKAGDVCLASTMNKLYAAVQQMRNVADANNPAPNTIMQTNNPNPVIRTLKRLTSECLCYTDCGGYYVCNCHGYCNNY